MKFAQLEVDLSELFRVLPLSACASSPRATFPLRRGGKRFVRRAAAGRIHADVQKQPDNERRRLCAGAGQPSAEDQRRVFYYSLFPNLLLSIHPDYVVVYRVWPRSPDRVTIVCDWLFHPEAFGRSDFRPDEAVAFWDLTNRQDWHVCELSQQGITSRAYEPGPYSPRKPGGRVGSRVSPRL